MNDKKTNSGNVPAVNGSTIESLSSHEREQCEKIESWISRVQNGLTQGVDTTDRMEQVAFSLWEMAQATSGKVVPSDFAEQESDLPFPEIEGYQIKELIGQGGMGVVYRAMDLQLKRNVALKVLPADRVGSERAKKRFLIEVQAAAQLEHPAIVPVYEYGEFSGGLYYSMREIDGIDLSKKLQLADSGPSSNDEASSFGPPLQPASIKYQKWVAQIGKSLAQALAHSHEQLVIHRDVKPANILVDRIGEPYLSDFGLARISDGSDLTADNDLLGTLRYMSPEQIESGPQQIDGRSDIYSLGVTLYELLSGQPAISLTSFAAVWKQIKEGRITKPSQLNSMLDTDLETIVLKAIAPEPEQRYESAQSLADDLERFLNVMPIHAKRATVGLKLNRWVKRNKNWVAVLGLVAGSLLAVIFTFAVYNAWRSARDAATIRQRSAELLDTAGVEKLFRGDALRAKTDFEQAAQLTLLPDEHDRQRLRIAAIDAWSPKLVDNKGYGGYFHADHKSGIEITSAKTESGSACYVKEDGKSKRLLFNTTRQIEFATISQDGHFCAVVVGDRTNRDPEIRFYDFQSGKLSEIEDDLNWRISKAWFLPDNHSLVTTGWGGSVQVWDAVSGKLVRSQAIEEIGSNPWAFDARTDRDKSLMAIVVNPGFVVAYRLPDLEPIWEQPIKIATWRADAFAVSHDGKWVAVGTAEEGVRIWEIESGVEMKLANNVVGKPSYAGFSIDNQYLAVGDDRGGVYVWKMPDDNRDHVTRRGVVMWHDYTIETLQFNEQLQLVVGAGNSVRVWRLDDNQPLTPLIPINSRVRSVSWTADNDLRIGVREKSEDRHQVWAIPDRLTRKTVDSGTLSKIFPDQMSANTDAGFDGLQVVAVSETSNEEQPNFPITGTAENAGAVAILLPSNIIKLAFSDDQQRLLLLQPGENSSFLLSTYDRKALTQIGDSVAPDSFPAHIDLDADGTRWITGGFYGNKGIISVGDVATGKLLYQFELPNWSIHASFLLHGQVASICWDGKLRILNSLGQVIGEFDHPQIPERLASHDDTIIVASGNTFSIYKFDEATGVWTRSCDIEHQSGKIEHIAISRKGENWVSCGDNGTTVVWSANGQRIGRLSVVGPVSVCRFSFDGRWLATLGESGVVQVWESATGKPMGPGIQAKTRIDLIEWSQNRLLFGGNDNGSYWLSGLMLPEYWTSH